MTIEERQKIAKQIFDKCIEILMKKGEAYAGNEDCLANFKRNAERLGLTKYQVWSVYANKHIDSVNNAIKYSPEKPIEKSESMEGRIIDVINYYIILWAMLKEDGLIKEE
jgi:hypothetical protein